MPIQYQCHLANHTPPLFLRSRPPSSPSPFPVPYPAYHPIQSIQPTLPSLAPPPLPTVLPYFQMVFLLPISPTMISLSSRLSLLSRHNPINTTTVTTTTTPSLLRPIRRTRLTRRGIILITKTSHQQRQQTRNLSRCRIRISQFPYNRSFTGKSSSAVHPFPSSYCTRTPQHYNNIL